MDTGAVNRVRDDLLVGKQAIADELGLSLYQVDHLIRSRRIPVGRLGDRLVASRTKLREHFLNITSGAPASGAPAASR